MADGVRSIPYETHTIKIRLCLPKYLCLSSTDPCNMGISVRFVCIEHYVCWMRYDPSGYNIGGVDLGSYNVCHNDFLSRCSLNGVESTCHWVSPTQRVGNANLQTFDGLGCRWGQGKMAAIMLTAILSAFPWKEMFVFFIQSSFPGSKPTLSNAVL